MSKKHNKQPAHIDCICAHCKRVVAQDGKTGSALEPLPPEYMQYTRKKRAVSSDILTIQEHQRNLERRRALSGDSINLHDRREKRVTTYEMKTDAINSVWIEICESCKKEWYILYTVIPTTNGHKLIPTEVIGNPCKCKGFTDGEHYRGSVSAMPVDSMPRTDVKPKPVSAEELEQKKKDRELTAKILAKPERLRYQASFPALQREIEEQPYVFVPPTDEEKEDLMFINRHKPKVELDIKLDPDASW